MINEVSLDTLCGALCYALGIEPPAEAAPANEALVAYVDEKLGGKKADRIVMYNPDAIAEWIWRKYPDYFKWVLSHSELEVPFCTVMPSVTPVCFGTMYTGAQPAVHGIQRYEKPVIQIDTFFDALIRAGKKPVIIAQSRCSMAHIFKEREMDYFLYDTYEEINAKAAEVILKDEYDVVCVYNGNYDSYMHKNGPEAPITLAQAEANSRTYGMLCELVKNHWGGHNTLVGFAMDHGCHEIDEGSGSHGLDMPEDLNIVHRYMIYPENKE